MSLRGRRVIESGFGLLWQGSFLNKGYDRLRHIFLSRYLGFGILHQIGYEVIGEIEHYPSARYSYSSKNNHTGEKPHDERIALARQWADEVFARDADALIQELENRKTKLTARINLLKDHAKQWRESQKDENNTLDQTVENAESYGREPVDIELAAGEISIHSDLLLHGSKANDSDRRRCGLTLRYCAAEVRAEMGWNAKGVVVSGTDADGHWANPSRPASD